MRLDGSETAETQSEGAAEWSTVLDAARPTDALEEANARASVKAGLFGDAAPKVLVSRYVLLERIGAGALGVVYSAYDPQLDRKVAVKLVKPGVRGKSQERVQREARALARLAHPNVITVHDVGTHGPDDSVFIVMELVEGSDLKVWLHRRPRSRRRVLDTFIAAGRGLAAAHKAGLVHRDFKPANVLIGVDGRVRVVDFGLARPGPDSFDSTGGQHTQTRGVAGTPAYMAPEQHAGKTVDARADQYAFCVSLYEALHGSRPFVAGSVHQLHRIKERGTIEESTEGQPVPSGLRRALERGLSPRPEDRFASMEDLLEALVRQRKRGRWWVVAAAAVSMGAVAVLAVTRERPCQEAQQLREQVWSQSLRRELGERFAAADAGYAPHTWRTVDTLVVDYLDQWVLTRTRVCEATLVRHEAELSAMNRRFRCLDRGLEAVDALAEVLERTEPAAIENAVAMAEALPPPVACEDVGGDDAPDRDQAAPAERGIARAQALLGAGLLDEALAAADEAVATAQRLDLPALEAEALLVRARTHLRAGNFTPATASLYEALRKSESIHDDLQGAQSFIGLAEVATRQGDYDEAQAWIEVASAKAGEDPGTAFELDLLQRRALLSIDRGDAQRAVAEAHTLVDTARSHLGEDHTRYATALSVEARALELRGDSAGARALFEDALATYERRLGADHPSTAQALVNLAAMLDADGEHEAALEAYGRAREAAVSAYGPTHELVAHIDMNAAVSYADMGKLDEAITRMRDATELLSLHGRQRPDVARCLSNLGAIELDAGQVEAAKRDAEEAVEILVATSGPDNPITAVAELNLARVLAAEGQKDEAQAKIKKARATIVRTLGEDHPHVAGADRLANELE